MAHTPECTFDERTKESHFGTTGQVDVSGSASLGRLLVLLDRVRSRDLPALAESLHQARQSCS